jgi:hypothetical protein
MIVVESHGIRQLLDILENVVKLGQSPTKEKIDALLSTKSISFMIEAYSRWPDFSKKGFVKIIANLANANSVGQGTVLSKLEEGFRSCLSLEVINLLREKLEKILTLDFTEAERIALKYLPSETPIRSTIHLTIDTYNPGMIFKGNVSLSILPVDPENFEFSYLAHELHHSGFQYWIRHNPKLKNLAFKGNVNHQEIAVNMILHLLSEGMANYYCTPNMVRTHTKASKRHNRKIKKYERNLNPMMLEIQSLLSDCISKSVLVEECRERLMNIILDPESILPPVHFIGAHIVEMFDKDPRISKSDIVNLCKEPSQFFTFYSQVYKKHGFPSFSSEVIEKVSALLGKT